VLLNSANVHPDQVRHIAYKDKTVDNEYHRYAQSTDLRYRTIVLHCWTIAHWHHNQKGKNASKFSSIIYFFTPATPC